MEKFSPLLNPEGRIHREMNRPFPVMDLSGFNRDKSISDFNGPGERKQPNHEPPHPR